MLLVHINSHLNFTILTLSQPSEFETPKSYHGQKYHEEIHNVTPWQTFQSNSLQARKFQAADLHKSVGQNWLMAMEKWRLDWVIHVLRGGEWGSLWNRLLPCWMPRLGGGHQIGVILAGDTCQDHYWNLTSSAIGLVRQSKGMKVFHPDIPAFAYEILQKHK